MTKRRVNLTIDETILDQARALNLNLSRLLEEKLADSTRAARAEQWLEDNREAIQAYNERIERDGPVLDDWSRI